MIRQLFIKLLIRLIDASERAYGVSMEYLRHMARVSPGAVGKFGLFVPMARHRRALPVEAYYVAGVVATLAEDCGTCLQIVCSQARQAGVPAEMLQAVLAGQTERLPEELADVYHFVQAVNERDEREAPLRERIRGRYGEEALVDLALGMAAARVFPVTKRVLGFATSCALVDLEPVN